MNDVKVVLFDYRSYFQLFRYVIVGTLVNILGYLLYISLTSAGFTPKLTMTVLYGFGVIIGFFGNKQFTFAYRGGVVESVIRYGMAHLFGYLLNLLALVIFVDIYKYPHAVVQGVAVFVVAGFLFLCFKFFVFKLKSSGNTVHSVVRHL